MVPFHAVHHSTANFGSTAGLFDPVRCLMTRAAESLLAPLTLFVVKGLRKPGNCNALRHE